MRIALALLALAIAPGCTAAPNGTVTIPRIPEWQEPAGAQRYTAAQVRETCATLAPRALVDLSDGTFTPVNHTWLESAVGWAWEFGRAAGIHYAPEAFDCDKFAKAFSLAAEIAASRANVHAQPLLARIYVIQRASFAGVNAGGAHALNAFLSDRGIFVLEPQPGGVRRLVPLSEYPNRDLIYVIKIGG